jgi:hypothetical protein
LRHLTALREIADANVRRAHEPASKALFTPAPSSF